MKRVLALLLSFVLVLALLPAAAAGEGMGPYTVSLGSKTANGEARVYVFLSSETEQSYSAFWLSLTYDESALEFLSAENVVQSADRQIKAAAKNGVVTVAGCGQPLSIGDSAAVLRFRVKESCLTQVQLTDARVSARTDAKQDARPAKRDPEKSAVTIASGYYEVTLPAGVGLFGDAAVAAGGSYTFRTDPHYDYTFDASIGGSPASVTDNGDGSYTIPNVTGPLKIEHVNRTPKSYPVTVAGSGSGDVNAAAQAVYGQDFVFTVTRSALSEYAVTAVADGRNVALTRSGDTYTISGADVTGPVVITVAKVTEAETTLVLFVGSGASDVTGGTEQICRSGEAYAFTLTQAEDCDYAVSVGGQTLLPVNGVYTIPAELVQGAILTVSVTKTARMTMTVTVSEYLSGRLWLVEAAASLPVGRLLAYDGAPMVYCPERQAYLCVVDKTLTEADARGAITVATGQAATLTINGDANDSGLLDVNDGQMIYDMYMGEYGSGALTQAMWLRADVNGDRHIDVQDVQTLLRQLVE